MKVIRTIEVEVLGLGALIKAGRLKAKAERGLTLTDVASRAGMSTQNWYEIEKERQSVSEETLKLIEEVLEIKLGVVFDES